MGCGRGWNMELICTSTLERLVGRMQGSFGRPKPDELVPIQTLWQM
jgi:hypothetical protein